MNEIKILTPPELKGSRVRGCRGYKNLKVKYSKFELKQSIGGRKVKLWKLVYSADDEEGDEYIPIFHKKGGRF